MELVQFTFNYYLLAAIVLLVIMGAFLVYYFTECISLRNDLERAEKNLRTSEKSVERLGNKVFEIQSLLINTQIEKTKALNMSEMFVQAVIMPEDKRTVRLTDVEDKYNELLKKW